LFDSDNDMFNKILEPGQQIDFYHSEKWLNGKVEIAVDEMVKCSVVFTSGQKTQIWIEQESDKLAPENSMTKNDKEHLHRFYTELAEFIY